MIGGQEIVEGGHGIGAIQSPPDPRDKDYLARSLYSIEEPGRKHRKHYTEVLRMDQGPIGQCTMASAAQIISAGPITQRPYYINRPHFDTIQAYCRAQELDRQNYGWTNPTFCQDGQRPRGAGDTGATMRSAAQVLRELGFVGNYWWMESAHEARVYLTNVAPLWFASYWYSGMSTPNSKGFVAPTGRRQGGHAYAFDEIVWSRKYVWLLNSWGTDWGHNGRAKMEFAAMDDLFAEWGEAIGLSEVLKQ